MNIDEVQVLKEMLTSVVYDHEYNICQFCSSSDEGPHKRHCLYSILVLGHNRENLEEILFLTKATREDVGSAGYKLVSIKKIQNPLGPLDRELRSKNGVLFSFLYGGGQSFILEGYADEVDDK
jgi:hypothetical protein